MARYTEEEIDAILTDEKKEPETRSVIVNLAAVLSAILVSTGIVGALLWLNIFIWSKVF